METIITIHSNALLELQSFTSKDKTRPVLQNIAFNAGMAYATDSYRGISHPYTCEHEGTLVFDFKPILPLLKLKKNTGIGTVAIMRDGDNYFAVSPSLQTISVNVIEGTYPVQGFETIIGTTHDNNYEIGLDTSLLPKGRFILKLDPNNPSAPISITTLEQSDYRIVLMPLRINN